MTIAGRVGVATSGWSGASAAGARAPTRQGLTLEATASPQAPHEFSAKFVVDEPELVRRSPSLATDPVSRAYLGVKSFGSAGHKIDIYI